MIEQQMIYAYGGIKNIPCSTVKYCFNLIINFLGKLRIVISGVWNYICSQLPGEYHPGGDPCYEEDDAERRPGK